MHIRTLGNGASGPLPRIPGPDLSWAQVAKDSGLVPENSGGAPETSLKKFILPAGIAVAAYFLFKG